MAYFEHTVTGTKFEIVRVDNEKNIVTLKGDFGVEFDEPYSKERFVKFGYKLIK